MKLIGECVFLANVNSIWRFWVPWIVMRTHGNLWPKKSTVHVRCRWRRSICSDARPIPNLRQCASLREHLDYVEHWRASLSIGKRWRTFTAIQCCHSHHDIVCIFKRPSSVWVAIHFTIHFTIRHPPYTCFSFASAYRNRKKLVAAEFENSRQAYSCSPNFRR